MGIPGVAVRDDTVVPEGSSAPEREEAVKAFRTALDRSGAHVASVAAGLSSPVFRHGALAANRPEVRRLALRRVLDAVDLAAELAAPLHVLDLRHEPAGRGLEQDVAAALDCYAEAVNACCDYVADRGYEIEVVVAPSSGSLLPSLGHALAFLHELDHPELVGLAPALDRHGGEVPFHQEAAQALWADKLFHVGLSGLAGVVASASGPGRRDALLLVDLLLDAEWDGTRQVGEVPLHAGPGDGRGADATGAGDPAAAAWHALRDDLAAYRALEGAAARLRADPDVAAARSAVGADALDEPTMPDGFSPESFAELRSPEAERDDREDLRRETGAEGREQLDALLDGHLRALDLPVDEPEA